MKTIKYNPKNRIIFNHVKNSYNKKYSLHSRMCSWTYSFNLTHSYYYFGPRMEILQKIMESLGVTTDIVDIPIKLFGLSDILAFGAHRPSLEDNIQYLKFSAPKKGCLKRMMFKFTRYITYSGTDHIIHIVNEALQAGCNPMSAFILGHYYRHNIPFYNPSMDCLGAIDGNMVLPYDKLEELYNRTTKTSTISSVFIKYPNLEHYKYLIDLVSNKKYIEAEKQLYKWKEEKSIKSDCTL